VSHKIVKKKVPQAKLPQQTAMIVDAGGTVVSVTPDDDKTYTVVAVMPDQVPKT
jgi:hypothetical protein